MEAIIDIMTKYKINNKRKNKQVMVQPRNGILNEVCKDLNNI